MDMGISEFIAAGVIAWLSGYGAGLVYRYFRQIMEKASRT